MSMRLHKKAVRLNAGRGGRASEIVPKRRRLMRWSTVRVEANETGSCEQMNLCSHRTSSAP